MNKDLFGSYAWISYGISGIKHVYKVVSNFQSNTYCDVPLTYQTENNPYIHDEIVDVLNVIHCGISEDKVIRVALKDCELVEKPNALRDLIHAEDPYYEE